LYAAVESAVRGLCESLRWEVASCGIHVGLITLGSVANEEPAAPEPSVLLREGMRDRLSRTEVAEAVLFMLSRPPGVNVDEIILTPLGQRW
jgi:NADP-dependent 3-hydroxy acid dehydrogenase YdfG